MTKLMLTFLRLNRRITTVRRTGAHFNEALTTNLPLIDIHDENRDE